jgi:dimethylargininase
MKFQHAIVRTPCPEMVDGITTADLGKPDYEAALGQHAAYIAALRQCGVAVTVLEPDRNFPDSVFIEDAALLTRHCAILTNPGAPSRNGEPATIRDTLEKFYANVESITGAGTVDAGDIMMVGDHFYIGLTDRTNREGAEQMQAILEKYGLSGSVIPVEKVLHLKTGVAYLENNILMASGEFVDKKEFSQFSIIEVGAEESYAGNSVWVNDTVLTPKGYPNTLAALEKTGYRVLTLEMSEFRKLDGGLSCLSLRF